MNGKQVTHRKLTKRELTQAIRRYCRRHNYYADTVRQVTALRLAAIAEWREDHR